ALSPSAARRPMTTTAPAVPPTRRGTPTAAKAERHCGCSVPIPLFSTRSSPTSPAVETRAQPLEQRGDAEALIRWLCAGGGVGSVPATAGRRRVGWAPPGTVLVPPPRERHKGASW